MKSLKNAMRVVRNKQAERILEAERNGATIKELMPLISGKASNIAMMEGRFDDAQLSVGQGIGRVREIKPAGEIVQEVMEDFYKTHEYMTALVKNNQLG